MRYRHSAKHMQSKTVPQHTLKSVSPAVRVFAGLLTLVLVVGVFAALDLRGLFMMETSASVTAEDPTSPYYVQNRFRKDGLYVIRSAADTTKVLESNLNDGDNRTLGNPFVIDTQEKNNTGQIMVLQIDENLGGGIDKTTGEDTASYGIRAVHSHYWMFYKEGRVLTTTNSAGGVNYRDDLGRWAFEHNTDGSVYIRLRSDSTKYLYLTSTANGTEVSIGALNAEGIPAENYKWYLENTHLPDTFLKDGTYFIETYGQSGYTSTPTPTQLLNNYVCGIYSDNTLIANEVINASTGIDKTTNTYMQFKIQKVSGGFYTIVNLATGKYLKIQGSVDSQNPAGTDIKIVSGQDSANYPDVTERWIIAPTSYSGNSPAGKVTVNGTQYTGTSDRFRIISAYNGHQLTNTTEKATATDTRLLTGLQSMQNANRQTWFLKSIYKQSANNARGKTLSGETGVYADTFDVNDTVTLPIRIYDYAADGMLFEYASVTSGTEFLTYGGKTYRMGNNNSFTMQSRSTGGTLGLEWHAGNYPANAWAAFVGDGSGSFDYNKYWAPYVSGMKFTNTNGVISSEINNPQLDLNSAEGGYSASGHATTSNPAFAATAGGMNVSTSGIDFSTIAAVKEQLSFPLLSKQTFGTATIGLTESDLREIELDVTDDGVNNPHIYKLPKYRQETVEYIALVLQRALAVQYSTSKSPTDSTVVYNYNYVDGETTFADPASGLDLASLLRGDTAANPGTTAGVLSTDANYNNSRFKEYGSYAETASKSAGLIGTWNQVSGNIDTCMDAAYWMLNSIFLENSYNQPQSTYTSLVLTKVTDTDGRDGYIFDSTFIDNSSSNIAVGQSSVQYDPANGTIRNTSAAGKSFTFFSSSETGYTSSYPFTPVRDANGNQTQTQTPYPMDEGVNAPSMSVDGDPEYTGRNYNYVLQSNASFIYHADDQLYFQFEGDDDVYLFINNELVVDIGGAHAVVGSKMNLNDYVEWAWEVMSNPSAYTEKEVERAERLALVEGNSYSFDFYYMERHGYGSNMRIFTNFQLTDTNLGTKKTAYQNEQEIPYGGVVASDAPVEYGFKLTNRGNSNLYSIVFDDADIGISLDWHKGLAISDSTRVTDAKGEVLDPQDLVITLTDPQGEVYPVEGITDADALCKLLTSIDIVNVFEDFGTGSGLLPGWTLEIRGIYYTLSEEQVSDGIFTNVLSVKAYTEEGNSDGTTNGSELHARSDAQVRVHSKPLYYQWSGHELTVPLEKFMLDVTEATNDDGEILYPVQDVLNADSFVDMYLCGPTGMKMIYDYVAMDAEHTLRFTYPEAGGYYVSVKIIYTYEGEQQSLIVPFSVFVTDVKDRVFVLDYGLGTELTENGALTEGDVLSATGRDTTWEMFGITDMEPSYADNNISFVIDEDGIVDRGEGADDPDNLGFGKYTYNSEDNSLRYDPSQFMEGADRVWASFRVSEEMDKTQALGNVDINKEVEMYKSVTVIPANVVYYEDTFAAVDYESPSSENTIEVFGSLADTVSNDQGADQDVNYGFDEKAYAADNNVQMSHGVCTKIPILDTDNDTTTLDTAATFTFKGTGFELVGRTNAKNSAIVSVEVYDENNNRVKRVPVITEFDHGADGGDEEIYQVPVVRVTGLDYGSYTVKIIGLPLLDFSTGTPVCTQVTYLYVDGVRIYNPIQGSDFEDNYKNEKGAQFTELRDLIIGGQGVAARYSASDSTISLTYSDLYVTEDRNAGDRYETTMGSLAQFLAAGPNNEVYINSEDNDYAIVLNVKETGSGPHLLQIGVHDVDENAFYGVMNAENAPAYIRVGILRNEEYTWTEAIMVRSGTEQYLNIDYKQCPVVDGYYQVVIDVEGFISFTNIKHNNLEFKKLHDFDKDAVYIYHESMLKKEDENGNPEEIENPAGYPDVANLEKQLAAVGYTSTRKPVVWYR